MRTSNTQTQAPRSLSFKKEDGYHYLKVQKDSPKYESPLETYLDMESPTEPGKAMYELVSKGNTMAGRRITGHSAMVMLRCKEADYLAEQKRIVDEARFLEERVEEGEEIKRGGPISL